MRASDDQTDIVIITGLSGAGRSTAGKSAGGSWSAVVDNLPPGLLPTMVDLAARSNGAVSRMAAVVDVRSRAFSTDLKSAVTELGARGAAARVVFLEAAEETLVRRFDSERGRIRCRARAGSPTGSRRSANCSARCAATPISWSTRPT